MQLVPYALGATVGGLALAPLWSLPPVIGWTLCALALGLALLTARHQSSVVPLLLLLSVFLISANLRYDRLLTARADVVQLDQLAAKSQLTGAVVKVTNLNDGRSRLNLRIDRIAHDGDNFPLQAPLWVRLYLDSPAGALLPGDRIECRTRLRQPRRFGTPGEFHWPRYLAGQGVEMTGWLKSVTEIQVVGQSPAWPWRYLTHWRQQLARTIAESLPSPRAELVRALALGEGRVLPDSLREIMARSGISHLFAISGLHLGLLALLGYAGLSRLYRRLPVLTDWQPPQRVIPLLLVPLLLGYLLLTGDAVATRRAFFLFALGALLFSRRYEFAPLMLLAVLALFSLLLNPLLLWQAGWQLSFAGAAGILLWRPCWQSAVWRDWPLALRYLMQLFLVSLAAIVATAPLVLLNFHLFSPAAILANLFCVPLITLLVLPTTLIALALSTIWPAAALTLFQACGWLLEMLLQGSQLVTELPGLRASLLFLSRSEYLAVALLVLPFLLAPCLWSRRRAFLALLLPCLLAGLFFWQDPFAEPPGLSLTMFSVGQGESLLLRNAHGQAVLIDGGGLYSDRFDVGERLLAPAFGELGVDQLEAVVLSHDHPDHRKGLLFVLQNYPVRRFISGHRPADLDQNLTNILRRQGIPLSTARAGWQPLSFWSGPPLYLYQGAEADFTENDASLVLYLRAAGDQGALLTGDLGSRGILKLLDSKVPGPVALLKIPHHGSRYSATGQLLELLDPDYGLLSAGYQNHYYLPAEQVLEQLQSAGIPLYRTDLDGTIQAKLVDNGWQVKSWREGLFH